MGAGSSLEAEHPLVADVPAGAWTLVADCVVLDSVDVSLEILQRRAAGGDVPIVAWYHHFDPSGTPGEVQAYEVSGSGPTVVVAEGDRLVFRYTGEGSTHPMAWIPNGGGASAGGRVPYIDLPR